MAIENFFEFCSDESPKGEDVSYHPNFELIESEIKKSNDIFSQEVIDWELVYEESLALLSSTSKDLRLMLWWMQANQEKNNTEQVFCSNISYLKRFIETFNFDFFPARPRSRQTLITHYTETFSQQLEDRIDKLDIEQLSQIEEILTFLNDQFEAHFDNEPPYFKSIMRIRKSLKHQKKEQTESNQKESNKSNTKVTGTDSVSRSTKREFNSIQDVGYFWNSQQGELHRIFCFLLDNKNYSASYSIRVNRLSCWGAVEELPFNKEGTTLINELAKEKKDFYQGLFNSKNYIELIKKIELELMSNIYWFDGQYLLYQALKEENLHDEAQSVLLESQLFTQKLPELFTLTFQEGTLFISEEVSRWLSLPLFVDEQTEEMEFTALDACYEEALYNAKHQFKTTSLEETMAPLLAQTRNAQGLRERFYWRLTQAKLLCYVLKPELALPIINQLLALLDTYPQWDEWEPELRILVLEVKMHCYPASTPEYEEVFKQLYLLKPTIAF